MMQISKKSRNRKKSIKITIRKCVQEREIDPNPTHYTKFYKCIEKQKKSDWFEIGNYIALLPIAYLLLDCLLGSPARSGEAG